MRSSSPACPVIELVDCSRMLTQYPHMTAARRDTVELGTSVGSDEQSHCPPRKRAFAGNFG